MIIFLSILGLSCIIIAMVRCFFCMSRAASEAAQLSLKRAYYDTMPAGLTCRHIDIILD